MNRFERARMGAAAVLLGAATLVGCTSNGGDNPNPDESASASPEATISAPPLPKESDFKGKWAGAASDVKLGDCPLKKGSNVAKGTVKNSSDKARDYQVMVIWLKNDDGQPYGSGLTIIKGLKPGEEKAFEIKAKVVVDVDKCALNVRAGTLA